MHFGGFFGVLLKFLAESFEILKDVIASDNGEADSGQQNNNWPSINDNGKGSLLIVEKVGDKSIGSRQLILIDKHHDAKTSKKISHLWERIVWNDVRTLADGKALIDSNWIGTEDGPIE